MSCLAIEKNWILCSKDTMAGVLNKHCNALAQRHFIVVEN
jgi:hypothetical protein